MIDLGRLQELVAKGLIDPQHAQRMAGSVVPDAGGPAVGYEIGQPDIMLSPEQMAEGTTTDLGTIGGPDPLPPEMSLNPQGIPNALLDSQAEIQARALAPDLPEQVHNQFLPPDTDQVDPEQAHEKLVRGSMRGMISGGGGGVLPHFSRIIEEAGNIADQKIEAAESYGSRVNTAYNAISDIYKDLQADKAELDQEKNDALAEAESDVQETRKLAQYPALDYAQIQAYEEAAQSDDPNESLAARKALAQAEEVQPGRWWANRSKGQKAGAIMGILLAGWGRGDQPNVALNQINKFIDEDIEAQRRKGVKRGYDARNAQSYYDLVRRKFDDQMAQWQATKALMLEEQTINLKQIEAQARTTETKLAAKQAGQQLALQAAQSWQAAKDRQAQMRMARMQAMQGANLKQLGEGPLQRIAAHNVVIKELEGIMGKYEDLDWTAGPAQYLPWTSAAEYADWRERFSRIIGKATEQNRMSDHDAKFYLKMIPTAGSFEKRGLKSFGHMKDYAENAIQEELKTQRLGGRDTSGFSQPVKPEPGSGKYEF